MHAHTYTHIHIHTHRHTQCFQAVGSQTRTVQSAMWDSASLTSLLPTSSVIPVLTHNFNEINLLLKMGILVAKKLKVPDLFLKAFFSSEKVKFPKRKLQ